MLSRSQPLLVLCITGLIVSLSQPDNSLSNHFEKTNPSKVLNCPIPTIETVVLHISQHVGCTQPQVHLAINRLKHFAHKINRTSSLENKTN